MTLTWRELNVSRRKVKDWKMSLRGANEPFKVNVLFLVSPVDHRASDEIKSDSVRGISRTIFLNGDIKSGMAS